MLAQAQPTQSDATQSSDDQRGADIIVTAQRRDESLSKTSVAVQILGGDGLDLAQIRTQDDLRVVTPSLSIRSGNDSNDINLPGLCCGRCPIDRILGVSGLQRPENAGRATEQPSVVKGTRAVPSRTSLEPTARRSLTMTTRSTNPQFDAPKKRRVHCTMA